MSTTTILLLILIGIAAGFLSGLVGIGGGVIIVPALVLLAGFSQKLAQGTSLGILLLPVGILGVMQYYKQGYLNVPYILIIAAAFVVGSFAGSKLALNLSEDKMKKIFAIVMLVIAVKMLFFDKTRTPPTKDPIASSTQVTQPDENTRV